MNKCAIISTFMPNTGQSHFKSTTYNNVHMDTVMYV